MLNINISELILTILNFLLLIFVLSKLLFKPLITFMDERKARIDAGLAKEQEAEDAVQANERRSDDHVNLARREAEATMEQSRDELRHSREELESALNDERVARRKSMAEDMEKIEQAEKAQLAEKESSLALLLSKKLLGE